MTEAAKGPISIRRRPVTAADAPFILALYASTRAAEMALVPWEPARKEAFVAQQNEAQLHHYATHFPQAIHEIIVAQLPDGGEAEVGRVYTDYGPEWLRLLDITIAAPQRNQGIGAQIMAELKQASLESGVPIRFSVFKQNVPAQRFYERLGFQLIKDHGAYLEMGWEEV